MRGIAFGAPEPSSKPEPRRSDQNFLAAAQRRARRSHASFGHARTLLVCSILTLWMGCEAAESEEPTRETAGQAVAMPGSPAMVAPGSPAMVAPGSPAMVAPGSIDDDPTGAPIAPSMDGAPGAPVTRPDAGSGKAEASLADASSSTSADGGVSPIGAATTALPVAALAWQACGDAGDECALLQVPTDYAKPTVGMQQLAVKRRPARGPRLGVLVVNFGGPGISGVGLLSSFVNNSGKPLNERFDVVTYDPRGVGTSAPIIDCRGVDTEVRQQALPTSATEWARLDRETNAYVDACAAKNADLLSHVGTWDSARDLDRLREALGEETLSYYGVSYGTALGSRYAELYPSRVRAMVLDASMNDGMSRVELTLQEGKATETALGHFFASCDAATSSCGAWTAGQPAAVAFERVTAPVYAGQLRDTAGRALGAIALFAQVRDALTAGLPGWAALNRGLSALARQDAVGFLRELTRQGASSDGTYDNGGEAFAAIGCYDMPVTSSAEVYAQLERFRVGAPHFGMLRLLDLLVCAHWPAKDLVGAQRIPRGAGAPPIVVIGTTGDPATPYDWSVEQATHFEGAVLVTHEGEGHGAFGAGSTCIDAAVKDYLISRIVPEHGLRCADVAPPLWKRIAPLSTMR